ncbi:RNA-binding domain-containing protein [Cognatitamlana onchidii]|uniref:RNA-binding domain-containing protein n=1 Tax=Cognatitamlana onchidii TaxID=2562860 RepID=UPI0010A68A8E|nr:transporter substrate-binding domain-containing protein [Algibacter onchidii]
MDKQGLNKLLFFISLIVFSTAVFSQSYKVACLNDYPPYSSLDSQGKLSGFIIDWWDLWSKETGIGVIFVPGSLDDCIDRLKHNRVDIIAGGFYSDELSEVYDFGDQILATQAILCIRNGFDPVSMDSLDLEVSHVKNGYTGMYLKEHHPDLKLNVYEKNAALYDAVQQKALDAFVYITPSSVLNLADISIPDGYKQYETLFTNNLRPVVKKGNERVLADIMKGSESISNEDLLEVAKKWNVFKDKVALNKSFLYVLFGVIIALITGILLVGKRVFKLKRGRLVFDIHNLESEISKGESDFLEFKSSLRWDYYQNSKNKDLEVVVAKTISAFLNSNGGMLLIGVDDEGTVLGLDNDYSTLRKNNRDGFVLALITLINNTLGKQTHKYISTKIVSLQDKDICVIEIERSNKPVFLVKGEKEEFFIRASASSQPLGLKDTMAYIESHWKSKTS